ncbi:MAG: hypothetical protein V4655_02980 [Bdellovibrionota bacterium]|nr:MAG: hypothetical protein EOP10_19995 [Pseudomonadota bacterium]
MNFEMTLSEEYVDRSYFLETRARNYSFQPGDFGYENIIEFEPIGLLTSPFPHSSGYTFYVVYANARHERLMRRFGVGRDQSVTEYERYRYAYRGAQAY